MKSQEHFYAKNQNHDLAYFTPNEKDINFKNWLNKIAFQSKSDHPRTRYTNTLSASLHDLSAHLAGRRRIGNTKCPHAAFRPLAGTTCGHTLNGLDVTAVAVMLLLNSRNGGVTYCTLFARVNLTCIPWRCTCRQKYELCTSRLSKVMLLQAGTGYRERYSIANVTTSLGGWCILRAYGLSSFMKVIESKSRSQKQNSAKFLIPVL